MNRAMKNTEHADYVNMINMLEYDVGQLVAA